MASVRDPRSVRSVDREDPRFLPLEVRAPTADARCVESSLSSLGDEITPIDRFFIRSHFSVPQLTREDWRLSIEGEVDHPTVLTFADLESLPHRDLVATMECAGNSRSTVRPKPEGVLWGHGAVSTGRWRGVPLAALLERAGLRATAQEVVLQGADRGGEPGVEGELRYEMSIDVAKALHSDTLVVDRMNGEPLPPPHGFPARALAPGYYGMASVKWLVRVRAVARPFHGYFRDRAYSYIREGQHASEPRAPARVVRVKSLVTWPREGQIVASGPHVVRGVAWSGTAPIARVDVNVSPRTTGGEVWRAARLLPVSSRHAWTHWEFLCEIADPGFYVVRARATDEDGNSQPAEAEWNFRGLGNNSIHCVPVEVRAGGPPDAE
jgi:DMSO/TMAO reductase YedYZ molybdopterin-dependent catalytic subunit